MAEPVEKESAKFLVSLFMTIDDVGEKARTKKDVKSMEFSCQKDPSSATFYIHVRFDQDHEFLSVFMVPVNVDVTYNVTSFVALGTNGNTLAHNMVVVPHHVKHGVGRGYPRAIRIDEIKDETMMIFCILDYSVDPERQVGQFRARLQSDFVTLFDSETHADVTFMVQGESIKAHRNILAARASYFARVFEGKWKESATNQVEVPDFNPKVFKAAIKYLYGGLPEGDWDFWIELLKAADKYEMIELKELCESTIAANLDHDNVIDAVLLADEYNCSNLLTCAKVFFKIHVGSLKESKQKWQQLKRNPALLLELFESCV